MSEEIRPLRCSAPNCRKGVMKPCNDREYDLFQYSKIPTSQVTRSLNGFFNTILYTHNEDEILVACNCCSHHHVTKKSRLGL